MRVTLDTNVFGPVADPSGYPTCPDTTSCIALRQRISSGDISAFVSEGSMTLEALSHDQRIDEFLREWAAKTSGITLPTPHLKRLQIVEDLLSLGVKVLHVPNIALGSFVVISPQSWASDDKFPSAKRQERHSNFVSSFPAKGLSQLKQLGASLATQHQLSTSPILPVPNWLSPDKFLWVNGVVAEYDHPKQFRDRTSFVKHVRQLVSEWCDIDILASHYAYGNDYFCTFDEAKKTGASGILHPNNRPYLESQFGVKIIDPRELLALI